MSKAQLIGIILHFLLLLFFLLFLLITNFLTFTYPPKCIIFWHKFKKIEIISNIFSDHSSLKLKFNYKKKTGKLRATFCGIIYVGEWSM